jgi:hypothetical protein
VIDEGEDAFVEKVKIGQVAGGFDDARNLVNDFGLLQNFSLIMCCESEKLSLHCVPREPMAAWA